MPQENDIAYENKFAESILNLSANNKQALQLLAVARVSAVNNVFGPISILSESCKFDLTEIKSKNENIYKALKFLIEEHSSASNQRLGIFKNKSTIEIMENKDLISSLLTSIRERIESEIKNSDDVEKALKLINEAGFCYVEYMKTNPDLDYLAMKNNIMPSKEELQARISGTDVGLNNVALTTGIGKKELKDIAKKSEKIFSSFNAGKSFFYNVSLYDKACIMVKRYDATCDEIEKLEKIKGQDSSNDKDIDHSLQQLKTSLQVAKQFMEDHKIPLKKDDRKNINVYVKPTSIEKLAFPSPSMSNLSQTLIASNSGTESRSLIALTDLGVLNSQNKFDFDKALIMSNMLAASILHGGHHSYIELVEPYNRLLDVIAVRAIEAKNIALANKCHQQQIMLIDIGDQDKLTFCHKSFRDDLASEIKKAAHLNPTHSRF